MSGATSFLASNPQKQWSLQRFLEEQPERKRPWIYLYSAPFVTCIIHYTLAVSSQYNQLILAHFYSRKCHLGWQRRILEGPQCWESAEAEPPHPVLLPTPVDPGLPPIGQAALGNSPASPSLFSPTVLIVLKNFCKHYKKYYLWKHLETI